MRGVTAGVAEKPGRPDTLDRRGGARRCWNALGRSSATHRAERHMAGQYCTFRLGGHLFGVPVETVQEVLRQQDVTVVPLAAPAVRGLINLRGQIVVTVDLRAQMGLPPRDEDTPTTNVVVRNLEGATSLLVDEIGDVLEPDLDRFEAPPETVPSRVRDLVVRVCKLEHDLMLVLDTDKAVTTEAAA